MLFLSGSVGRIWDQRGGKQQDQHEQRADKKLMGRVQQQRKLRRKIPSEQRAEQRDKCANRLQPTDRAERLLAEAVDDDEIHKEVAERRLHLDAEQ